MFAGLTALRNLTLYDNVLIALPADVFEPLTSLTSLYLHHNDLATLPAGVFGALTALTDLQLHSNDLTTLPADVFEPLTSLTNRLYLDDNPGAPFAPVAVALPDDGTVSSAGGTVMLDGSGSDGGPWGEYLTYSWALTNPSSGVTVTFDDAGSATPVGTVQASDGDNSDSVTGYAIEGGADASKFSIVASTGVLTFASAPNYEDATDADGDNAYVVVVRATSGAGERVTTADQTITVTVTDADGEAPGVPAAPSVSAAGVTSVTVSWAPPANAGPAITDYDYQYRVKTPPGSWAEVTNTPHGAARDDHDARGEHRVRRAGAGDERRGHERLVRIGDRADHRIRARRPQRPHGNIQCDHPDRPLLDRPGQHRRLRHHRLQDRGLLRHRRVVDRPRRQHRRRQHNLLPHRARRRHHPPLPRLGHQLQRHRRRLNVANAATFTTRPGAPTGLTATASWTTQINLSWTTPASDGGSAITTYVIDVSPDGITNWRYRAGNVNADTTYSQIGLAPGTTRHYRVVAINANGFGPNSNMGLGEQWNRKYGRRLDLGPPE